MLVGDTNRLILEVPTMNPDAEILEDTVVPAGQPWSRRIAEGEVLRPIDLEGQQAIDFLCYNADDLDERYHAPNTMKIQGSIYLGKGSSLLSVRARRMMTIIEDTCGGHDTIFGCCSFALDEVRYGKTNPRCCQQNFEEELALHGMGPRDVVPNVNFFMRVPVAEAGHVAIVDGISKPGDYVDLRADMDVLAVLSNCPQMHNPCNGYNPTPIRVTVTRPVA
jgi:urea carboxylase-associated protein 1